MSAIRLRAVAAVAAAFTVAACAGVAPPQRNFQPLSFSQYGTLAIDAGSIDVVDQYKPPMSGGNVDHLAPTPPLEAVRRWASDRLKPQGGSGMLRVVIKDASIKEVALPRTTGLTGTFTKDQAWRYDGRIEVEIVGKHPGRLFDGNTSAMVTRSTSVPEDASLLDRERTWQDLTQRMMEALNTGLEQGIRNNLQPMLVFR